MTVPTTYRKPTATAQVHALLLSAGADGLTDKETARLLYGSAARPFEKAIAKHRGELVRTGAVAKSKLRRPDEQTDRLQSVWVAL